MNHRITTHLAALAAGALLLFGASQAFAATAAATVVTNTATISFTANGTDLSSAGSASFTVDHMIDPVVVRDTAGNPTVFSGATSGQQVEIQYTLTNAGNSTQGFKLELVNKLVGDSFDVTLVGNIDDASGAGGNDMTLVTLAAGASQTVFMTVQVPAGKSDTETAVFWLQAAAWDSTASPEAYLVETGPSVDLAVADIVFADADGEGDGDGLYDGKHTGGVAATCTLTVGNAVLTVDKSSTVLSDPFGSATPYRVPGAVLQYTIRITNGTGATVTLTDFADAIPAELELLQNIDAAGGTTGTSAVLIDTAGTARPSASATDYAPGANVTVVAGVGGDLGINLGNILTAEAGYAAGELKDGEYIEIKYNTTIQ